MSPPGVPSQAAARAVMCRTASGDFGVEYEGAGQSGGGAGALPG